MHNLSENVRGWKMIQLSYWLFPLLFLVFLGSAATQAFLLPGLVAACAAGAANSAVVQNYPSAVAHGLAAALCVFWVCRPQKQRSCPKRDADALERLSAVLAWTLLALVACYVISDASWPYSLSKQQMLVVFLPFLAVGAVVRGGPY